MAATKSGLALLLSCVVSSAFAATPLPYTFTNGQPADASQLNSDLTTLSARIDQLQAQLAALQPVAPATALLGTWNFVTLNSFGQPNGGQTITLGYVKGTGTVTFTNGTFQITQSNSEWTDVVGVGTNTMDGSVVGSSYPISSAPQSGTYTVSGSTVTMNVSGGGSMTGTLSGDGHVLIFSTTVNGGTGYGITIAIKQ